MPEILYSNKTESQFLDDLSKMLTQDLNVEVEKEPYNEDADLIVEDKNSGKRVLLQIKDGGNYGELPNSIVLNLDRKKKSLKDNDFLFLVSFSRISTLLKDKLTSIGVNAMASPSVGEVVNQIAKTVAK